MFVWPLRSTYLRKKRGGRAGETTAVHQPLLQAYQSAGGNVVRTARVPLLYPCRYAREKLSVRESDRRCSSLEAVFPSVEPTAIGKVCIQFAGFEQN